jgi:hypothetical protein
VALSFLSLTTNLVEELMVKFPVFSVTDKGWGMILTCCANTAEQYKTKAQKKEKDFNMVTFFNNDDEFLLSILRKR